MNDVERYNFDRMGYLHIPALLTRDETRRLYDASIALEADALACRERSPKHMAMYGMAYWQNQKHGYYAHGNRADGQTLMVEDFWLYPGEFDFLVGHERTLAYVKRVLKPGVRNDPFINNSELRIRYTGNHTGIHMGFPWGHMAKYRYNVLDGHIDCAMVRMVYFLHDVGPEDGPIAFVPGSHKSAFPCPREGVPVEEEPGIVPVYAKAGDAVFFTEACRHGGFTLRSNQTRYTLHVGYGPSFLRSQNISTMDENQNVTPALLERLTPEQRQVLVLPGRTPIG